jgi:hypothetical protein
LFSLSIGVPLSQAYKNTLGYVVNPHQNLFIYKGIQKILLTAKQTQVKKIHPLYKKTKRVRIFRHEICTLFVFSIRLKVFEDGVWGRDFL